MNISFTKFLGIVLAIVAVYLIYYFWWADQDQADWRKSFHEFVFRSSDSSDGEEVIEPAPDPSDAFK